MVNNTRTPSHQIPLFFFQINLHKTRYAYGITSRTKKGTHILLFDLDNHTPREFLSWMTKKFGYKTLYTSYPTPNGWHFIIWRTFPFNEAAKILIECPYNDQEHVKIGFKRGYWFLETAVPTRASEYMVIQRA